MSKKAISRNAPCPCGSGKKYKICCLNKESNKPSEALWRQLNQVDRRVVQLLLKFAGKTLGEQAIHEAWSDFVDFKGDESFDFDSPQNQAFFPWFLFNWRPEDWEVENAPDNYGAPTIAESFIEKRGRRLSDMERRFMEMCGAKEFSFHEVLECRPGTGFTLRDILLEHEVDVTEHSGSEAAQQGDIFFAKVIEYDHVGLLVGCGPVLIPPSYKTNIIDLRAVMRSERAKVSDTELVEWNDEIRNLYLEIYDVMHRPPELRNTDGDPLSFHEMTFETGPAAITFEKLKSLSLDMPEDELLEDAEFDNEGILQKVELNWLKKNKSKLPIGEYTTLAYIIIDGKKLTASVNSAKRATRLRKEIQKRLKGQVTHRATEVKSVDEMTAEAEGRPQIDTPEMTPEVEAAINQTIALHWQQWIDDKIPALGGTTPRQAVKNKDGREKVIALLDDAERAQKRDRGGVNQLKYIQQVRKQLGLGTSN